jgi:hypothetical protein
MKTPPPAITAFALLALPAATAGVTGPAPATYHDHAELSARLRALAAAHPRIASVTTIGRSFEERELLVLTLGETTPGQPAVFVDAAHDGRELAASEVALGVAEHMLEVIPPDSLVNLLRTTTFHVLARANPDGAERGFTGSGPIQSNPRPTDEDGDERADEDGPEDIDGDGLVAWLRVPDPAGEWTPDPTDDRLLVARKPGDPGPFYRRHREGIDNDDDGLLNEDPEGGVSLLHNFPQGWEMEHAQPGAGRYAASEAETRAILEFFVAHPEIALVISLSQEDRPERPGAGLASYVPDADQKAYAAIDAWVEASRGSALRAEHTSEARTRIGGAGQLLPAPRAKAPGPSETRAVVPGHFAEWAYFQTGAFTIMPQVWARPPAPATTTARADTTSSGSAKGADASDGDAAAGTTTPGDEPAKKARDDAGVAWLRHVDAWGESGFVSWTPFDHPMLGPVEIGGFAAQPRYHAPESAIDSLAAETASLVVALAGHLGRVRVHAFESAALASDLHRVTLTVENAGDLPTLSARGADSGHHHGVLCEISLPPGATLADTPERVAIGHLAPGERRGVEWLVRGSPGASVRAHVWSVRAGAGEATLTLSR